MASMPTEYVPRAGPGQGFPSPGGQASLPPDVRHPAHAVGLVALVDEHEGDVLVAAVPDRELPVRLEAQAQGHGEIPQAAVEEELLDLPGFALDEIGAGKAGSPPFPGLGDFLPGLGEGGDGVPGQHLGFPGDAALVRLRAQVHDGARRIGLAGMALREPLADGAALESHPDGDGLLRFGFGIEVEHRRFHLHGHPAQLLRGGPAGAAVIEEGQAMDEGRQARGVDVEPFQGFAPAGDQGGEGAPFVDHGRRRRYGRAGQGGGGQEGQGRDAREEGRHGSLLSIGAVLAGIYPRRRGIRDPGAPGKARECCLRTTRTRFRTSRTRDRPPGRQVPVLWIFLPIPASGILESSGSGRNPTLYFEGTNTYLREAMEDGLREKVGVLRERIRLSGDERGLYRELSDLLFQAGKVSAALNILERSLDVQEGDGEPPIRPSADSRGQEGKWLFDRGLEYADAFLYEDAVACFQRSLDNGPETFEIHYCLSGVYKSLEKFAEAERHCRRSLVLNARFAPAYILLGSILKRPGSLEESVLACKKALLVDPDCLAAYYDLACYYSLLGKGDQSLAAMEMALCKGFTDFDWLLKDPDLESLRLTPEFQLLLRSYREKSL